MADETTKHQRYREQAERGEVLVADVLAAFLYLWQSTTATVPPDRIVNEIRNAATVVAARQAVADYLVENVTGDQLSAATQQVDVMAMERARQRAQVIGDLTRFTIPPGTAPQDMPGLGGKPFRAEFLIVDVEKELDRRVGAIPPGAAEDSVTGSALELIRGDAPVVEEEPGRLELPFIGGLGDVTSVGETSAVFGPAGIFPESDLQRLADRRDIRSRGPDYRQRYRQGFEWRPASWSDGMRQVIKNQMIKAGYLDRDDATGGAIWAYPESSAFELLLLESNDTGDVWQDQLSRVASNPSEAAKRRAAGRGAAQGRVPFVAPPELKPDLAALSQGVKQAVRNRLGREPTGSEMAELIDQLGVDYRAEYQAEVLAARSQYDATTRAIESGAAQTSGAVQTVDPTARFAEAFETRFRPELGFLKRREGLNERQAAGDATLSMIDSVIGGRA